MPGVLSVPFASSVMACMTAAGVGIIGPLICSAAALSPFACTMRRRKMLRIVFCVSSVLSTPNFGMTFSQTDTSQPSSAFRHCCIAVRFPARTMGNCGRIVASICAL